MSLAVVLDEHMALHNFTSADSQSTKMPCILMSVGIVLTGSKRCLKFMRRMQAYQTTVLFATGLQPLQFPEDG
jgi:hypothetical protein